MSEPESETTGKDREAERIGTRREHRQDANDAVSGGHGFELKGNAEAFGGITATHVAAGGWILTAGCYGFAQAQWGATASQSSNFPEYGWVFLLMGLGIGVGFAGSLVASMAGDDE